MSPSLCPVNVYSQFILAPMLTFTESNPIFFNANRRARLKKFECKFMVNSFFNLEVYNMYKVVMDIK